MTSATKSEEKRLDRSTQSTVDQPNNYIKPAAEARKHAQFAREMPQPRHSGHEKLDLDAKRYQNQLVGVLLGECRLEELKGDRAGQHSVRINGQWRICFVWTPNGPADVEIVDYH
ncbi:type II toxin-antitoxin system RelE/ParE family toxin [Sedimentitalea todarodis]|uniref:Type II toxin-antitoxin system RelE/ParE family toxin n=2 Tax=Sedimentitalea todarodis TaxID=1631240 RepID=A0ABU3VCZ9_9RHOB|nr:type II toxin-antitoxin system RelE/ParE family toxin [Sedimentitalea todarodis]